MKTVSHGISRRHFLMAAAGAGALFMTHGMVSASGRRPNVVLFLVDDMGWMDSTVYGSRYYETPNVARLASRSMRFTSAYSAAPLCSATRAAIMTGKYPARTHITSAGGHLPELDTPLMPETGPPYQEMLLPRDQRYLPLEEITLGEALHDAGYRTAFVGKWHLGHDARYWPEHQGFDVNAGGGRWPGPPSYFSPYHIDNLPDGPEGEYIADRLTDEAVAFLRDAKDEPFFLNFWQYAVHAPYQSKDEYRAYFEEKKDPRGAQDNAVMAAMIKSMDESLGRVLDTLEALGVMDNTIIIFSSDNGGNMYDRTARDGTNLGAWAPEGRTPTNNAPLRGGKGSVYEGGIRVPTMVHWPGVIEEASVSDALVSSIDYYPTILDMIGVSLNPVQIMDGISIVPALRGNTLKRHTLYGHFPHYVPAVPCRPASWVRDGDWKLIRFYETDEAFPSRIELYNLVDDIGELDNLAEVYPERVARMERMLDRHLDQTGALVPMKNPNYNPDATREILGWRPSGDCWLEQSDDGLVMHCTGGDPFVLTNAVEPSSGDLVARFRMLSSSKGGGQFFWTTETIPGLGPEQRLDFAPQHDGEWHEYQVLFTAESPLRVIRLDPSTAPGDIEIAWVRIETRGSDGGTVQAWEFTNR